MCDLVYNKGVATLFSPFFECYFVITDVDFSPFDLVCVSYLIELIFDSVRGDAHLEISICHVDYIPFHWGLV